MTQSDDRPQPDEIPPEPQAQAFIGWIHHPLPHGIELRLQSTRSASALEQQQVDTTRLVLTRNQALLLATFLLKVTGQSARDVPEDARPWWKRWLPPR